MNEDEFKKKLTPEQYKVLREKGTEAPFSGKLLHESRQGAYNCAACGNPLFSSDAKFDGGIESLKGWPSFEEAIPGSVVFRDDNSHGMRRTEVVCGKCGSHLGHIFDDSVSGTGKHFCINSVCLNLTERK